MSIHLMHNQWILVVSSSFLFVSFLSFCVTIDAFLLFSYFVEIKL